MADSTAPASCTLPSLNNDLEHGQPTFFRLRAKVHGFPQGQINSSGGPELADFVELPTLWNGAKKDGFSMREGDARGVVQEQVENGESGPDGTTYWHSSLRALLAP